MTSIDKPVALVTGGSSGIGLAIARRFRDLGMQVVLVGRRQGAVDAAVHELGGDVLGLTADVAKPEDLDRLFAEVGDRFGRLDVLVPNCDVQQCAASSCSTKGWPTYFFLPEFMLTLCGR